MSPSRSHGGRAGAGAGAALMEMSSVIHGWRARVACTTVGAPAAGGTGRSAGDFEVLQARPHSAGPAGLITVATCVPTGPRPADSGLATHTIINSAKFA